MAHHLHDPPPLEIRITKQFRRVQYGAGGNPGLAEDAHRGLLVVRVKSRTRTPARWLRLLMIRPCAHSINGWTYTGFVTRVQRGYAMPNETRIVIVTGAAGGLGSAIARNLSEQGDHCILVDRAPDVRDIAKDMPSPLGAAEGRVLDIIDDNQLVDLIVWVEQQYGRLDVLVNNAGIHPKPAGQRYYRFDDISLAQWNAVLAVNLTSVFRLSQLALPLMRARRWGRIINMSSRTARTYSATAAAHYAASKSGMIGLTRVIAGENGEFGITANCIAPGPIDSPMSLADGGGANANFAARAPLRRVGTPPELAATVRFLASDEAGYITGAIIDINGGSFMP